MSALSTSAVSTIIAQSCTTPRLLSKNVPSRPVIFLESTVKKYEAYACTFRVTKLIAHDTRDRRKSVLYACDCTLTGIHV